MLELVKINLRQTWLKCHINIAFVVLLFIIFNVGYTQEIRKASQCFKSRGIPKVSFSCEQNSMIKIVRAFHGISDPDRLANAVDGGAGGCVPNQGQELANCSYCEGDCIDDSMNLVYDWSTCMGNTSCLRTVMQSYMPACSGREKFSDYLQVEYQCIPKASVIDICSATQQWQSEGHLTSPNYPEHYPTSVDCLCTIQTDWNARITLSFYDLLLETKQGRCRADWLMLRQKAQKHRHCGAIMTGTKNITSETNAITLQFHTDENDNTTQNFQYFSRKLKGFWLYFASEPTASLQVSCRQLTAEDVEVQEILSDDADYTEVLPPEQQVTAGDDDDDGGDTTMPTRSNDTKDKSEEKEKKNNEKSEEAKENEVDAQEGSSQSGSTISTTSSICTLVITVLLCNAL